MAVNSPPNGGYIRLYRKLAQNPVWTDTAPAVVKVMLGFLMKANWQPTAWQAADQEIKIPRGSFITTVPMMAEYCNVSPKQARTAFAHLEAIKFATYHRADGAARGRAGGRAGGLTLVAVCNYERYQAPEVDEVTRPGKPRGGRKGGKVINKEIKAPPTPSSEGALFDLPKLENATLSSTGGNGRTYQATLEAVASSIHARHPTAHERRNCSVSMVQTTLKAILKHKRIAADQREAYLRRIDANHAGMCASEQWQKDGGEYVKGLRNWLAPKMELYEIEATSPAPAQDAYLTPAEYDA